MRCFRLSLIWIALTLIGPRAYHAYADYYPSYYSRYYPTRPQTQPIISLELNPKVILNSSFRIAAREERQDDMQRLLRQKADINSHSDDGETALMYAARNCSIQIVKTLISDGADINAEDKLGRTALIYAAQDSCAPVIDALLATRGIHARHHDQEGKSAIDYARDNASLDVDGEPVEAVRLLR